MNRIKLKDISRVFPLNEKKLNLVPLEMKAIERLNDYGITLFVLFPI